MNIYYYFFLFTPIIRVGYVLSFRQLLHEVSPSNLGAMCHFFGYKTGSLPYTRSSV